LSFAQNTALRLKGKVFKVILVVDDELRSRFMLVEILRRHGYEVVQASDGMEALTLFSRLPLPDVVITDLRMPGLDGADLALRIHAGWPGTGVILTSGYFTDKAQKVISAGLADFIYKPIEKNLLLAKIQRLLLRLGADKVESTTHQAAFKPDEFRKTSAGQTWHSSPDCTDWPQSEFQTARVLPVAAQLCNECLVKGQLGARK
jgi:CheY-like chemotaxis protein